jgi:hypothetical protein
MKPYVCPFCKRKVDLFKHFGKCKEAFIALDEGMVAQAYAIKAMTPEQLETEIGRALTMMISLYEKQTGAAPPDEWCDQQLRAIRAQANKLRGG